MQKKKKKNYIIYSNQTNSRTSLGFHLVFGIWIVDRIRVFELLIR